MNRIKIIFISLIISACSTTPNHVGVVHKTKKGNEFSIKDTKSGFLVAGHFSEYQFVRNSRSGFTGCMRVINSAARDYSDSKNDEIGYPKWDEIEIIDHGRDIISAIMHVNCQYEYKFIKSKCGLVQELEKLKNLYDSGAINKQEYEAAKKKVLEL